MVILMLVDRDGYDPSPILLLIYPQLSPSYLLNRESKTYIVDSLCNIQNPIRYLYVIQGLYFLKTYPFLKVLYLNPQNIAYVAG